MKYKSIVFVFSFIILFFTTFFTSEANIDTEICEILGTCDEYINENPNQNHNENMGERVCGKNSVYITNTTCNCISGYIWENLYDKSNLDCIMMEEDTDIDRILCDLSGTCSEDIDFGQTYNQSLKGQSCGRNSIFIDDTQCGCMQGYQWENLNDKSNLNCIKKNQRQTCSFKGRNYILPQNAHCVSNDKYNAWLCNKGYKEYGNTCIKSTYQQVCDIKGNISFSGEKIYHLRSCENYTDTKIDTKYGERYFCSEYEAQKAGWRKAKNCY